METLNVALGSRSYPIHVGQDLLSQIHLLRPHLQQPKVAIVSNVTVAPLYLATLANALRADGNDVVEVILPDGEEYKDWRTLHLIFDALVNAHCERLTTLIALGGGVVGDIVGFAAACYQRGMPFIQIPTTLLAQVDSSVGGKTAINHPSAKNMIGAFYQPRLVLSDVTTLSTLPDRELRAGLAEVIKYGLIRDPDFFSWLEQNIDRLLAREPTALIQAVCRSCSNKAAVVVADEHEHSERALLNLGHTFGHAIEALAGFGNWLHGEAVAAGTVMAAQLSWQMGWLENGDLSRIEALYRNAGLPLHGPAFDIEQYLAVMQHDKKVKNGKLRLVLLRQRGAAVLADEVPSAQIRRAIATRIADD